jgi:secreted trypsin-like serine protease
MLRRLVIALAALAAVSLAAPAAAVINGVPDGEAHPNVGGLVAPEAYPDGTWAYCTGTLISPRVFLTAAHCEEDQARVRVTFSSEYEDGDPTYAGIFHADPRYSQRQSDPHDIAVVVLDEAVEDITPADLPDKGSLSDLPAKQSFTSVGYGAFEVTNQPGGHQFLYDDVRMRAEGTLNATNPAWLRISMNRSTGNGGTCFGDSGGPNFLGDSSVVAGITITGDAVCRATNVVYRLDTASALAFLDQYIHLP